MDDSSAIEKQLKARLTALAKDHKEAREQIEELLYLLHAELKGNGRGGRFTPFLRENMGWTTKRPYDKAARWIARYEYRAGLITQDDYWRKTGQALRVGSTPVRSASKVAFNPNAAAPPMVQEFTVVDDTATVAEPDVAYSLAELEADAEELARRQPLGAVCALQKTEGKEGSLCRMIMTEGCREWYEWARNRQVRRYGAKTYAEIKFKLMLLGPKKADKDDDWGCMGDEIAEMIGHNPKLAYMPDEDEREN